MNIDLNLWRHKRECGGTFASFVRSVVANGMEYEETVKQFEIFFLLEHLEKNRWNQSKTAAELGIHRNTLGRHLIEFGIDSPALKQSGYENRNKEYSSDKK